MHVAGIHHITAIASDPQKCVDFYTNILGLRLVKKSVNQDQVEAYHLFFGDKTGEPGMDLTFFTFPGIGRGARGVGAVTLISLAVPDVLFDLATMGPGFTADEPEETLGQKLALPPFLEQHRETIESSLMPIKTYGS